MSPMSREQFEAFVALADRYMLGELADAEFVEFEDWLLKDPQAAQALFDFVRQAGTMRVLFHEQQRFADRIGESSYGEYLAILESLLPSEEVSSVRPFARFELGRSAVKGRSPVLALVRWSAAAGAIAALVLLTFMIALPFKQSPSNNGLVLAPQAVEPNQQPVAYLTALNDARWEEPAEQALRRVGDALYRGQRLSLTEGFAEVTTRRGARAILQGPCTVELTDDDNALHLVQGKLVGICDTPSSRGFIVQTPSVRLVDVGTRFGVVHDGQTRARVIQGEVFAHVIIGDEQSPATSPLAGQSAVMDESAGQVVRVQGIEDRFVIGWDAVARPPVVQGQVRYEQAMPTDLRLDRCDADVIQLFAEESAVTLAEDLTVTLTEPGVYDDFTVISATLPAGAVVDSYLVHMDVPGRDTTRMQATIRFDRPILGVIAASQHLAGSHERFAPAGTVFQSMVPLAAGEKDSSGLEYSGIESQTRDALRLSEDRRTLTLTLYGSDAIDQVRILVQAAAEQEEQPRLDRP